MLQSIMISKCSQEDFKFPCRTEFFLSVPWTLSEPILNLPCGAKITVPGWSINLNCTCWCLCISKWQWQWLHPGDFLSESRFQILTELHRISMSLEIPCMELWIGFLSRMTDKKASLPVPWGVVALEILREYLWRLWQSKPAIFKGLPSPCLHQGWRQSNEIAMLWSSLPIPLKTIFHWFLVSWALWRSYSTEFQWNLRGKGQKGGYETGPHIFDHRDVPWLNLRGNKLSKVREGRKLQDARDIQGFGKVISSSNSESHSLVLQSPLPFPDVEQMPLLIGTCLMNGCFMFLGCLGFFKFF